MDWREAVIPGELIALAVTVALACLIALTRQWWNQPSEQHAFGGWFEWVRLGNARSCVWWILLAFAVVVAVSARREFAKSSLWWDEVWQARNASVGEWRPVKRKAAAARRIGGRTIRNLDARIGCPGQSPAGGTGSGSQRRGLRRSGNTESRPTTRRWHSLKSSAMRYGKKPPTPRPGALMSSSSGCPDSPLRSLLWLC